MVIKQNFLNIHTAQPIKEVWRYLGLFTDKKYLKKSLIDQGLAEKEKSILNKRMKQIISHINQAEEYYKAIDSVSIKTAPVLTYYGMLSLSEALILFRKRNFWFGARDTIGSRTHGLARIEPKKSGVNLIKFFNSFSCIISNVRNSTIGGLLKRKLKDRFSYNANIEGIVADKFDFCYYPHPEFPKKSKGLKYRVSELLPLLPDLADFLLEINIMNPKLVEGSLLLTKDILTKRYRMDISLENTGGVSIKKLINRREKEKLRLFKKTKEQKNSIHYITKNKHYNWFDIIKPTFRENSHGRLYFDFSSHKKNFLPEISILFILFFILGDLARYRSWFWESFIESTPVLRQLVRLILDVSIRKFPNLILNELRDQHVRFTI